MNVHGIKFVHYTLPKGRRAVIYRLVCGTSYPVVSVAGLCRFGDSVNFSDHKTALMWRNHHRAGAATERILYLFEPKYHGKPNHNPEDYVLDRSNCQLVTSPEATPTQEDRTIVPTSPSTVDKLWRKDLSHSDFRPWFAPEWPGRLLGVHR